MIQRYFICFILFTNFFTIIFSQSNGVPIVSEIRLFARRNVDENIWLPCTGGLYSPERYPDLFNAIGYSYGKGEGETFAVPNLQLRTIKGTANEGLFGRVEDHDTTQRITVNNIPAHTHDIRGCTNEPNHPEPSLHFMSSILPITSDITGDNDIMILPSGSDNVVPIDLQQPNIKLLYYIAAFGESTCSCVERPRVELLFLAKKDLDDTCTNILSDSEECVIMGYSEEILCDKICGSDTVILTEDNLPSHNHYVAVSKDRGSSMRPANSILAVHSEDIYTDTCEEIVNIGTITTSGLGQALDNEMSSIRMQLISIITEQIEYQLEDNIDLENQLQNDNELEFQDNELDITECNSSSYDPFLGEIRMFTVQNQIDGWVLCNGERVEEYDPTIQEIFENNFFSGDTFITPNLSGRIPFGPEEFSNIGETGGSLEIFLTMDNIPSHSHNFPISPEQPKNGTGGLGVSTFDIYTNGDVENIEENYGDLIGEGENLGQQEISTKDIDRSLALGGETITSVGNGLGISTLQQTMSAFYYMYVGFNPSQSPTPSVSQSSSPLPILDQISKSTAISQVQISPSIAVSLDQISPSIDIIEESFTPNTVSNSPTINPITPTIVQSNSPSNSPSNSRVTQIELSSSSSNTPEINFSTQSKTIQSFQIELFTIEAPLPANFTPNILPSRSNTKSKIPSFSRTCFSCIQEEFIEPDNIESGTTSFAISNQNGNQVGSITNIQLQGSTIVIQNNNFNPSAEIIFSPVVNITIVDNLGRSIEQLDEILTICLESELEKSDGCLSFYDEIKEEWICQDSCLTDGPNNQLCGETNHLTSFAVLLVGDDKTNDCESDSMSIPILFWVSLGLCGFCILFVLFAIILIQIRYSFIKRNYNSRKIEIVNTSEAQHL